MIILCQPHPTYLSQSQQTVQVLIEHRRPIDWPDWNQPEQPEPDHPSHEDPSPMYTGVLATNVNVSATATHVVVDSSASGSLNTGVPTTWLPVGPPLVRSLRALDFGERLPQQWPGATNLKPDTKKHLANPSTHKEFLTRRGGQGKL
jgi:hypothetical protein